MKTRLSYRILSAFLACVILFCALPFTAAADSTSTSLADNKTLSDYTTWFPSDSSRYAGGVFVDKSVYTATEAKSDPYFNDIKNSLSFANDNFGNENFMVALSALGSNSEVYGYSYTPTDTMIVLDASTSMGTGDAASSALDDMVAGANDAAKRLLSLNNYNRVGIVVYNGSASVLLPLDRYTSTAASGDILRFERSVKSGSGSWRDPYVYENRIYIASGLKDGQSNTVNTRYIAQFNGTYTQGGVYTAAQEFLAADTVIEDGKIQGGTKRLPIMVLMSDGEPSYRTKTGNNKTVSNYNAATNANCDGNGNYQEDDLTAFSTMLTAAWAESEISAHYDNDALFYTLGYALSANHAYAHNVLDPLNPNNTYASLFAGFARNYLAMSKGQTRQFVGNTDTFNVVRQSDPAKLTSLDYVDKYWQAANSANLTAAFDSIVDEIVIQSRYYSTLVSNNQHHQDGFISFTDEIGTHMEVKNLKGIYIGEGKLVTGGLFAEFATTGSVRDYDSEWYSDEDLRGFENEILAAASERFGITVSQASQLITSAKNEGFIAYTNPSSFSNYVAWYADEDSNFLAPYTSVSAQADVLDRAKYIVRSYFYMGDVTQNHVETSMLYALVRVREDIATGRQIVDMNVPAALLPMVTYTITVDDDTLTQENLTGLTCTHKKPLSLLYEVGLDSDITPYNLTQKMEGQDFRKNVDGSYTFYTNRWRTNTGTTFTIPTTPDVHVFNHGIMNTTVTQFIPSLENVRYYYTENTPVFIKDGNNYVAYTGAARPTGTGYYHEYTWVEDAGGAYSIAKAYNPITEASIAKAEQSGNGWVIPKGTPKSFFAKGDILKDDPATAANENITGTLAWAAKPDVVYHDSEGHTGYHVLEYLGNNGLVRATPAEGIVLTKEISQEVAGAPTSFEFDITLETQGNNTLASSYPVHYEYANGTTADITKPVTNGVLTVELTAGDTAYITGLPVGTEYTVTEQYNSYYSPSSTNAHGTITALTISPVHFVNSPKGYGSLLVEKDVTHPTFDTVSTEFENKEFDITVNFEGDAAALAEISAPANAAKVSDGVYTLKLKDGHDALFTHVPEGVEYTVTENNLPAGFTLKTASADLTGRVAKDAQSNALLVNEYRPTSVSPEITVQGEKTINGRDWDNALDNGKYQIALHPVIFGGQGHVSNGNPIIVDVVKSASERDYTIDMSGITYTAVGSYDYVIYEVVPQNAADRVPNISYDTSFGMMTVEVVDKGTGTLIVDKVTVHSGSATLSGNADDGWVVEKNFVNTHLATTVDIPVIKRVIDKNGQDMTGHSGGIVFGLFNAINASQPKYTAITDDDGKASFKFNIVQSDYQNTVYYYLRELLPPVDSSVTGMTYDTNIKYVVSIDWGNSSSPTIKYYYYDATAQNGLGSENNDITVNPLHVINHYHDNIVSNPLSFGGTKTINGGPIATNDSFTFKLYETDATFDISGKNAIRTDTATVADNTYHLQNITFDSVGTKYLVVVEEKGNAAGIIYDSTSRRPCAQHFIRHILWYDDG